MILLFVLSQITENTRDILIEVTSSTSLADAKQALDALLVAMVESRIGSTMDDVSHNEIADVLRTWF